MASQDWLAFRKWWWLVLLTLAVGIGGAFGSLALAQRQYEATCRLFVSVPPNTGPGESYQAAQFGQARVAAYLDLIKGERVASAAINSLNIDMSAASLVKRIDARADAESVVINVSVTDSGQQRSKALADAVCSAFLAVAGDAEGPTAPVNLRVIESATVPSGPVSPSQKTYLAAGAVSGLLVGIGVVLLLGRTRGSTPIDGEFTSHPGNAESLNLPQDDPLATSAQPSHRRRATP